MVLKNLENDAKKVQAIHYKMQKKIVKLSFRLSESTRLIGFTTQSVGYKLLGAGSQLLPCTPAPLFNTQSVVISWNKKPQATNPPPPPPQKKKLFLISKFNHVHNQLVPIIQ